MISFPTRQERGAAPLRASTIERLECLAVELVRRGMLTSLMAPLGRMPRLQIARTTGPDLVEDVYAWRGDDGNWWFWWAWAERIADATDLAGAAERIERLLSAPQPD